MIDKYSSLNSSSESLGSLFSENYNTNNNSDEIKYLWTRDSHLLKEYIKLIDERFRDEINWQDAYKKINDTDFESYFYLVLCKDEVIAGTRFSFCPSGGDNILPVEQYGFRYKDFFPELNLASYGYAEVDQYAAKLEYRNKVNYDIAFKAFKVMCDEKHLSYLFLPASRSRQRLYKAYAGKYFKFIERKKFDIGLLDGDADLVNKVLDSDNYWAYAYENF